MDTIVLTALLAAITALIGTAVNLYIGRNQSRIRTAELHERRIYQLISAISELQGILAELPPSGKKTSPDQDKRYFQARTRLDLLLSMNSPKGGRREKLIQAFDTLNSSASNSEFDKNVIAVTQTAADIVSDEWTSLQTRFACKMG